MSKEKKNCFSRKFFRVALWSVAGMCAIAVVLALALPLWISPVATRIAGMLVPNYTGTEFRMEKFSFNPYAGTLGIRGIRLSNPDGFGSSPAFSLADFSMQVDVGSLFSDTIIVKEVLVGGSFVSYYSNDGKNNFDIILSNVKNAQKSKKDDAGELAENEKAKESFSKKVVIEHLKIADTKVKLMKSDVMPAFVLPPLELKDIGKKSNGATLEEVWGQVANSVMNATASAGDGLGMLGGLLGDGFNGLSKMAEGASAGVASGSSESAKNAIDAVGGSTKKAVDGVKKLFKGFGK
ncbi:MAG: hypothetical protein J6R18_01405 [Kiritimatiellae bacterium]|nr:hypothetical protein [Kiritimatiellia bacterium]